MVHSSFSAEGKLVTLVYRGKINYLTLWQTVTKKGLINYCRVEWIKGGALPVIVIVDMLTGYLSVYFSVYWKLLRTICMGNLATKLKRIGTRPD